MQKAPALSLLLPHAELWGLPKKFGKQEVEFQLLSLPKSLLLFPCHSFSSKIYLLVLWEEKCFIYCFHGLSADDVYTTPFTAEKAIPGSMSCINPPKQMHHIYKIYVYPVPSTEKASVCCNQEGVAGRVLRSSSQEEQLTVVALWYRIAYGQLQATLVFLP